MATPRSKKLDKAAEKVLKILHECPTKAHKGLPTISIYLKLTSSSKPKLSRQEFCYLMARMEKDKQIKRVYHGIYDVERKVVRCGS
jgi:hypothetical protein